jgi:ribosomal protein L29
MDKIIVEYQLKTEELRKELGDVKKQLSDTEKQVETSGSKMSNTFKNVGKAIAGAFAIREIVQFGQEAIRLAATMEGVEAAFNRLGNPNLLNELRKATKGTVSDLQLMQNAVKANNFQIPLDQLGKMFSFAAMRARETGESVDYLVESITLGIARKSIPILDNLGISSIQIQEEFKKTGDFAKAVGNIIDESMGNAGETVETTAERMERFSASFQNFKANIGADLLPLMDVLLGALEDVGDAAVFVQDKMLELFNFLGSQKAKNALESEEARKLVDSYLQMGLTVEELTFKQRQLQDGLASIPKLMQENRTANNNNRESYEELVKAQDGMKVELSAVNTVIQILNSSVSGSGGLSESLEETDDSTKKLTSDMAIFKEVVEKIPSLIQSMVTELDRLRAAAQDTDFSDFYGSLDEQQGFLDIQNELIFSGQQLNPVVIGLTSAYQSGVITLEQYSDLLKQIKEDQDAARESAALSSEQSINDIFVLGDAIAGTFGAISFAYAQLGKENEKLLGFSKQAAFAEIILSQGVAIAKALQVASTSATNPLTFFTSLATILTAIFATIGQATSIASSAKIPKYATGVVDLKGAGTETSDSITARLSKGESVITAKGTRQDKGLFQAANKLRLEEYINKNYVLPVLLKKQQEDKAMFDDYRLYLALKDGQRQDRELNKAMIKAVTQRHNRYNNWN